MIEKAWLVALSFLISHRGPDRTIEVQSCSAAAPGAFWAHSEALHSQLASDNMCCFAKDRIPLHPLLFSPAFSSTTSPPQPYKSGNAAMEYGAKHQSAGSLPNIWELSLHPLHLCFGSQISVTCITDMNHITVNPCLCHTVCVKYTQLKMFTVRKDSIDYKSGTSAKLYRRER